MGDRILTLHPEGRDGVNIEQDKYNRVRDEILAAVDEHGEIGFRELVDAVRERLAGGFGGSASWYTTTVKLDLEARGELVRFDAGGRQRLRRP